jgi:hypothetical protein
MSKTVYDRCADAIAWFDTLSQRDADIAVDKLVDRIVAVLRRDQRMPRFTYEEWRLLFADAAALSRDELGALIEGKGDISDAADTIADVLADRSPKGSDAKLQRRNQRPRPKCAAVKRRQAEPSMAPLDDPPF